MKLSIVIVSYNVRYFLEQALQSVFHSKTSFVYEVFVVDNASADGSVEMVMHHFPHVKLIENKVNVGFSKANNQAIRLSASEYILLLNPDTIIQEDTLQKIADFMDGHPDGGGLGVKMIDGKGKFLPESKRGLPTPSAAFFKLTGLHRIFPKSRIFSQYYMGFLSREKVQEIEVLSGACMLLRRKALEKTGLLDEDYFMYGEDIDLSYRMLKAGYKNYYFPDTQIIHFKGESTRKESFRYVILFYKAMLLFVRKHFHGGSKDVFIALIRTAIWTRAGIAAFVRMIEKVAWYLADAGLIISGMFGIKWLWEHYVKVNENITYPHSYLYLNIPLYTLLWLLAAWLSGVYDKPYRISKVIIGLSIGTLFIAAIYGFLPMEFRSSRGMILSGYIWAILSMTLVRMLWYSFKGREKELFALGKRVVIAGGYKECKHIIELMQKAGIEKEYLGFVSKSEEDKSQDSYLGNLEKLPDIVRVLSPDEIIFSTRQVRPEDIMHYMALLGDKVVIKISAEGSAGIIGSDSRNVSGDIYTIDIGFRILFQDQRRFKRMFDIGLSLLLLLFSPILVGILPGKFHLWSNIFQVIIGKKSWVGYTLDTLGNTIKLPVVKPGVISPLDTLSGSQIEKSIAFRVLFLYAREYNVLRDIDIICMNWRKLAG